MVANNPSQKKPDFDKAETVERLNQVTCKLSDGHIFLHILQLSVGLQVNTLRQIQH